MDTSFGKRYWFDWTRIVLGVVGLLLAIVWASKGDWLLVLITLFLAYLNLGEATYRTYWSVSRCPFCHNRSPKHRAGCTSYWHEAHWD